ncbi:MAG: hypothetical protein JWO58_1215 [Chitinophagaceae bacterium]|nr:hypothetical protein [Chitinophagaceae bacterium]
MVMTYATNNLVGMSFNVLLSLVVVKLFSVGWWGELVPYLIIFQLASFFVSWGSPIYLPGAFAKDTKAVEQTWLDNVVARIPLLFLVALVVICLDIPSSFKWSMMAWVILNYGYRSYESLILYQQKFKFSLLLNVVVAACFIALVIINKDTLSVAYLMTLYVLAEAVKLVACVIYFYRKITNRLYVKNTFFTLLLAFPFFLQGLAGLLQSRIDTYYVAFALNKEELAKYHILISFLLLVKSIINMFLKPFLKNIYRMSIQSLKKIAVVFLLVGVFSSVLIIAVLYALLTYLYQFEIDAYMLLLSYLYIIPMYYYATIVYIYYKYDKEKMILWFGVVMVCFNLLLDIVLVSRYGISGALTTAVIQEWVMMLLCSYFIPKVIPLEKTKR